MWHFPRLWTPEIKYFWPQCGNDFLLPSLIFNTRLELLVLLKLRCKPPHDNCYQFPIDHTQVLLKCASKEYRRRLTHAKQNKLKNLGTKITGINKSAFCAALTFEMTKAQFKHARRTRAASTLIASKVERLFSLKLAEVCQVQISSPGAKQKRWCLILKFSAFS